MSVFITTYKPAGTSSFRLSSTKTASGHGGNAQNIDKHHLSMYIADKGTCFVQTDQAGAEALVVAYLARPGNYRDLFKAKIKPHTWIASKLFNEKFKTPFVIGARTPSEVKLDPDWFPHADEIAASFPWYDLGKKTCHSASYKIGPRTHQEGILGASKGVIRITYAEAKMQLDGFKREFPEIVQWQDETENAIYSYRKLKNLFGFERRFDRLISDGYVREAISWVPQSTVGCITHSAVRNLTEYIWKEKLPWRIISNKHDSYATRVPLGHQDHAKDAQERFMNQALVGRDGVEFAMRSETQWGLNFGRFSSKNPDGMKKL